jgi:hypothetical protein
VTEAHVDVLTRARAKADDRARAALAGHENELLDAARTRSPRQFQDHVDRFVKQHSEDDGRTELDRQRARRGLRLWKDGDGMTRLSGQLDPVSGQAVRTTLGRIAEQLWRRDHQDRADEPVPFLERTDEGRYADALVEACGRAERTDKVQKTPDKAIVILGYDTLVGGLDRSGIATVLADGTPIPASEARRLACDAGLIPVVLDGDSVPLDVGRAKRVATPAQRAAIGLQWSTCAVADCGVPFEWTELHHQDPFAAGGPTDLGNLIPACSHGHRLAHTPGWSVEKQPDGSVVTTAPDGRSWHRHPDGPGVKRRSEPPPAAAPDPGDEPAADLFDQAA